MENNNEKVMIEIKETLEKACKNIKFDFEEDESKREQERLERLRNHYQYEADKYKELNDEIIDVDKLVEAAEIFGNQGHSGFSAYYVIGCIKGLVEDEEKATTALNKILDASKEYEEDPEGCHCMQQHVTNDVWNVYKVIKDSNIATKKALPLLLSGEPLTPLTGEDDEWVLMGNEWKPKGAIAEYSNRRCSGVYKVVYPGTPNNIEIAYDLDYQNYSDNGGHCCFTGGRFPTEQIVFPYTRNKKTRHIFEIYEKETEDTIRTFFINDPETIKKIEENYVATKTYGCWVDKEKECDVEKVADESLVCCKPEPAIENE